MHRSLFDLTTEEAYALATERFGLALPPLDAIENEDWGRDMVLQALADQSDADLAAAGLTREEAP